MVSSAGVPEEPVSIRLPARPPGELLVFLDFIEQLNQRMREMRDSTPLPRTAVTLPDEFDDVVAWLVEFMRIQAREAHEAHESLVEIRLPLTDELVALARWAEPRMDLLTGLTRAGMVQHEWEQPLKLMIEIFETVLAQLPQTRPSGRDA